MGIEKVGIEKFLQLAATSPVLDARSPGEFGHAHFPMALNVALFTDEERKVVGTAYKQQGREYAIKLGLDYFGAKMRKMVEDVEAIVHNRSAAVVLVHCWRGGMRSEAVAWLLDLYGFKVYLLIGGYKKFRQYVLETFDKKYDLRTLGGFTGSGKTPLLHELARQDHKIIDLEAIANHKGSSFGAIGQPPQPTQEMFENMLALKLRNNITYTIWMEDESQRIGSVIIPIKLWEQLQRSPVYFFNIPFDERLLQIQKEYGELAKEKLLDAIVRIQKRLGGLETKMSVQYLMDDDLPACFKILLTYYDKCYLKSLNYRKTITICCSNIVSNVVDEKENAEILLQALEDEKVKNR